MADQVWSISGDGSCSVLGFSIVGSSGVDTDTRSLHDGACIVTCANKLLSVSLGAGKLIVVA